MTWSSNSTPVVWSLCLSMSTMIFLWAIPGLAAAIFALILNASSANSFLLLGIGGVTGTGVSCAFFLSGVDSLLASFLALTFIDSWSDLFTINHFLISSSISSSSFMRFERSFEILSSDIEVRGLSFIILESSLERSCWLPCGVLPLRASPSVGFHWDPLPSSVLGEPLRAFPRNGDWSGVTMLLSSGLATCGSLSMSLLRGNDHKLSESLELFTVSTLVSFFFLAAVIWASRSLVLALTIFSLCC